MSAPVDGYLSRVWTRSLALVAFVAGAVIQLLVIPAPAGSPYRIDFDVYRVGGQVFLDGGELYGNLPQLSEGAYLPFTYPPIAAAIFSVFTVIPLWLGSMLLTIVSIGCLALVLRIVLARVLDRPAADIWWLVVAAMAVALWLGPVRDTLSFGQVNILLMTLVVVDVLVGRDRRWGGVLTGLAISIKLTPLVFLLLFVLRRDWRAAAVSVVSALAFAGIGYLLMPADSVRYWTDTLHNTDRIGTPSFATNQSLHGMLVRLHIDSMAVWFGLALVVGLFIAWVAWRLVRVDAQVAATLAVAFSALYCSPLSWDQHWVWVAPLLVLLLVWAARGARIGYWLAASGAVIFLVVPHQRLPNRYEVELTWVWWQHLIGSSYLIWGLITLAAMGTLAPLIGKCSAPTPDPSPAITADEELSDKSS